MLVVGSWVPAKPSRFELWGAHEDFLPTDPRPSSLRSRGRTRRTHNTKTQDLYWFGPPLWCNTLLHYGGGGLPLGLMMNSTREEQPCEERCSCAWWCVDELGSDPFLLGWLALFIEALVLFPNIEREGIQ